MKKGKMLKSNGKYKCNPEWIKRTILIADSNNFEDINMNLKEYPKMEGYDFSENANPLGPSVKVQDALRECAGYINVYSDYKNIDINKCKLQKEEVDELKYFNIEKLGELYHEGIEWKEALSKILH